MDHLYPEGKSGSSSNGSNGSSDHYAPSTAARSPLEMLSHRSRKVHDGISNAAQGNSNDGRDRAYQAAFAMSRQTSMRNRGGRGRSGSAEGLDAHVTDDEVDWDDSRSIDLHGSATGLGKEKASNGRGQASGSSSSGGVYDQDDRGPRRFQDYPSPSPQPPQQELDRSNLLSSAFRSSIASDISFNSISGQTDRQSMAPTPTSDRDRIIAGSLGLARRDSVDTVRSSEFGDGGRWGRAWANKADDEESIYSRNEWDEDDDEDESDPVRLSTLQRSLEGVGSNSGGLGQLSALGSLRNIGKGSHEDGNGDRQHAGPQMRSALNNQHVVSLTPSLPLSGGGVPRSRDSVATLKGNDDGSPGDDEERRRIETQQQIKAQRQRRSLLQQRLSAHGGVLSSEPPIGGGSGNKRDSTATISGASTHSESSSNGSAHVYVYPPTPGASVEDLALRNGQEGRQHAAWGSEHAAYTTVHGGMAPLMEPQSADIETASIYSRDGSDTASIYSSASEGFPTQSARQPPGPVGPSAFLSRAQGSPVIGPGGTRKAGHPGGRPPPPPPPAQSPPGVGLHDASRFRGIGPARARAIADADGRESMVSDLDVETLRLDGSSRRGSTSTVASRMSVGTVIYEPGTGPGERDEEEEGYGGGARNSYGGVGANGRRSDDHRRSSSLSYADASETPKFRPAGSVGPQMGSVTSYQPQLAQQTPRAVPTSVRSPPPQQSGPTVGSAAMTASSSASGSLRSVSAPTATRSAIGTDTRTGPTAAEEFLSQGIDYHEAGELSRSAFYFERSANVEGGCVVGMTMWGMALREGWGARKDQIKGYAWIRKAYERARRMRADTQGGRSEKEEAAIRSELKLTMYELGKCYCYGWGVKMDKKEALGLFEEAGQLGDPDAAAEAGALWAAGKGCKKDLKRAAFFYRMAIENGCDAVGLSWVYKPKFL